MQEEFSKKLGKATKWSSIAEILAKLIAPVVNMVLARLLVPAAFGAVTTITMVISFAEVFTDAGFQKYLIQHEFASQEELDRNTNVAFWTNLSFSVLVCAVIFVFRHGIAELVGSPELGNAISIASISIILVAFSSIQMARYKRDFDFKTLFFVRMGTALIPVFVTIPLAIVFRNFWALLIGTLAANLFSAVALSVKSKWKPSFFYRFAILKEMLSFSAWMLLESIAVWLTSYADIFIVGHYLNEYYLGLYKTSMTTVNAYMAIVTASVLPVLFSALSRIQNDEKRFKDTYYLFQRLTAVLVIPMGIGMFLYSDLVTQILLGSQWTEASEFIGLWSLTSAVTIVFSHFNSEVYRSKGEPKIALITQMVHLAFLLPTLLLTIGYGFEALYVARSLIRIQGIITGILIMHCRYGFKIHHVIKNVLPTAICAVLMGAVGWCLQLVSDHLLWDLASIFICIIAYFAALFILFPKNRHEILDSEYGRKILGKLKRRKTEYSSNKEE